MKPDYASFQKNDFLHDDYFIRSIKYPDASTENEWNQWRAGNPPNLQQFLDARFELEYFLRELRRIPVPDSVQEKVWQQIQDAAPAAQKSMARLYSMRRMLVAACFAAIIGLGTMLLYNSYYDRQQTVAVPFASTQSLQLPDSTIIVVNANSSVRYYSHWKKNTPREVWLNGEAYFNVKHLNRSPDTVQAAERFIVHAGIFDIEVLGTVFNVKVRDSAGKIILINGKVVVRPKGENNWITLRPGEEFSVSGKSPQVTAIPAPRIDEAIAWKDRSIILSENATLNTLVPQLEENYGISVKIAEPELGARKIEGTLPITNKESLFFILKNVMKIQVTEKGDEWIITAAKTK